MLRPALPRGAGALGEGGTELIVAPVPPGESHTCSCYNPRVLLVLRALREGGICGATGMAAYLGPRLSEHRPPGQPPGASCAHSGSH